MLEDAETPDPLPDSLFKSDEAEGDSDNEDETMAKRPKKDTRSDLELAASGLNNIYDTTKTNLGLAKQGAGVIGRKIGLVPRTDMEKAQQELDKLQAEVFTLEAKKTIEQQIKDLKAKKAALEAKKAEMTKEAFA